jgi:TatD DNase family protein
LILPLDAHAHIEPDIASRELVALRSCVVAVTRTLDDFDRTRTRADASVVWSAGCHPGLVREVRSFSAARMRDAIATTPVIGEVGLDGAVRTSMELQLAVFRKALELACDTPRVVSIHSYRATDLVVRELRELRPHGAILHWWLGTAAETHAAIDAGAFFSINASQAKKWAALNLVPLDRILMETDHPFGDRSETQPRRPGNATKSEHAVAAALGVSADALRLQTWRNLRGIAEKLSLIEMFPAEFQVQFLSA